MALSTLRQRKLRVLGTSAVLIAALFGLPRWIIVNRTPSSAPCGIYFRTHRPFKRGDLVEVCLPHEVAQFAARRAYIRGTGRCGDNTEPVIKEIGAMPGEEVYVNPRNILATDSGGRSMTRSFPGWHRIPVEEIWLEGSARNSFDSRYFGPLAIQNVNAVLKPIVTW